MFNKYTKILCADPIFLITLNVGACTVCLTPVKRTLGLYMGQLGLRNKKGWLLNEIHWHNSK